MDYIMNKEKYADRTLSDEQIEHRISYDEMYRHSMSEMTRNYNEQDKKATEDSFEKRIW